MNTKLFVGKLNQITKTLFSTTPAQREIVHQSIQELGTEMGAITTDKTSEIRVLSSDELGDVNPLAVAVYYSAGFVAGWTFGKEMFK